MTNDRIIILGTIEEIRDLEQECRKVKIITNKNTINVKFNFSNKFKKKIEVI